MVKVGKEDNLNAILNEYTSYLKGGRYILCLQSWDYKQQKEIPLLLKKPVMVPGKDKPLIIYGLSLTTDVTTPTAWLLISGTNITLQNVHLTGPGPDKSGSVGMMLSGHGHQVLDSEIAGFATGIVADCAWPTPTVTAAALHDARPALPQGPSCTLGPGNTIGLLEKESDSFSLSFPT